MPEPILAIDFGTTTSAAILVIDGREELIEEPSGHGRAWPSSVSLDGDRLVVGTAAENRKRRHWNLYRAEIKRDLAEGRQMKLGERFFAVEELITALLAAMRAEAERVAGREIHRVVVTIPASYRPYDKRRELMIGAAMAAGFVTVELLPEPVAAGLAPATGTPIPVGSLLLVYDFGGGTFDTALVRVAANGNEVLGYAALDDCGGRDIDAELSAQVQRDADAELAEHTSAPRGRLLMGDAVTRIKHQLSEAETADDDYGTTDIVLSATRSQVEEITQPLIKRTLECVHGMLAASGVGQAAITAVLLVGGVTRMPVVRKTVASSLGRPLREPRSPELAVVQGAARFGAAASSRFAAPMTPRTGERPLRWQFPGKATITGWLVSCGEQFTAKQPLARVRLVSGAIWELRADDADGRVVALHAKHSESVFPGDWLLTAETVKVTLRLTSEPAYRQSFGSALHDIAFRPQTRQWAIAADIGHVQVHDWPPRAFVRKRRRAAGSCAVSYSPDGEFLASGSDDGTASIWDAADGPGPTFECGTPVTGMSFSRDGKKLATASGCLHVWEIDTGAPVTLRAGTVQDVCFSPVDNLLAASYPANRKTLILDASPGRAATVITEVECRATAGFVALSGDGVRFASGFDDDSAGIWTTRGGERVALLPHVSVRDTAFNQDGITCATGGEDGYARLCNIATSEELMRVEHGAPVNAVAFSPDGKLLGTAGSDGDAAPSAWQTSPGNAGTRTGCSMNSSTPPSLTCAPARCRKPSRPRWARPSRKSVI